MKLFLVTVVGIGLASAAYADDSNIGWKTESEAGVVITSGNTETSTLSAKDITSYGLNEKDVVKLTASYLYQKTSDVVSAKAWSLGIRYDRALSERVGLFLGQAVQGDRFKGLVQAYDTDVGAKYFFAKTDGFTWTGEGGYRFTHEHAYTYSKDKHFARAYTELEKKFNASVSMKYWLEALPNFTDSSDWQANTELSLSAVLSDIFSVKTAFLLKFDHEPNEPGLKPSDRVYTTSLVAKF